MFDARLPMHDIIVKGHSMTSDLLRAVDLALADQWAAAHNIVQEYESDAIACWIHAVLHKIEGDPSNSRYWYRRAGKMEFADHEPRAELQRIKAEFKGS